MLKCFLAVLKDLRDLQVGGGPLVGDRCFKQPWAKNQLNWRYFKQLRLKIAAFFNFVHVVRRYCPDWLTKTSR